MTVNGEICVSTKYPSYVKSVTVNGAICVSKKYPSFVKICNSEGSNMTVLVRSI